MVLLMACGERVEITETYWSVCWKWIFPYPCKKSRTKLKFQYDFRPTRTRITWPFRCKWEGCCGAFLYEWSSWCWGGSGNSAWDEFNILTRYFDSQLSSIGDCPFSPVIEGAQTTNQS
jgi:hypothetical protein